MNVIFKNKTMKKIAIIVGAMLLFSGCSIGANKASKPDTSQAQKGKEGEVCSASKICEEGLKCISNTCSSGVVGSACATYKDCQTGLYCIKAVCSNPPSYTQYFNKIQIGKMKPEPPGPKNIPVPATEFTSADALEIDVQTKTGVTGTLYYELINATTGQTEMSSADNKQKVVPGSWGTGFMIPAGLSGQYDLNIYFNDELIYTTTITVT